MSGVSLSDSAGETLGVSTLAAGQTVTSNAVQITALSGHHFDTASVTGTATAPGITSVVSAADTADYTAVKPSISIDDQVMVPGGTWQDVGTLLQNPTTVLSGPVYFRSIVTNTGPTNLANVSLTDTSNETLGVTTLTAGQTVTSSTVQITAPS